MIDTTLCQYVDLPTRTECPGDELGCLYVGEINQQTTQTQVSSSGRCCEASQGIAQASARNEIWYRSSTASEECISEVTKGAHKCAMSKGYETGRGSTKESPEIWGAKPPMLS
jgi:hypothetical protein